MSEHMNKHEKYDQIAVKMVLNKGDQKYPYICAM